MDEKSCKEDAEYSLQWLNIMANNKTWDLYYAFYNRFILHDNILKKGGTKYQYAQKLKDVASRPTIEKFLDMIISYRLLISDSGLPDVYVVKSKNFKRAVESDETYQNVREVVEWNSTLIIE